MGIFNKKELRRIEELEHKLEQYRKDNQHLRDENKRLEEFELKVKIMEMYVDDDEAILELLELKKEKERSHDGIRYANILAAQQQQSQAYGQLQGLSSLGQAQMLGIFGR